MDTQSLKADIRNTVGKGAARQMRAQGQLPAVFYGRGLEGTAVTVSPKDLLAGLKTKYGRNVLFQLDMGGRQEFAMLRELQIHPLTRQPVHADFLRVDPQVPVTVSIPLATEGRAKGVVKGGELRVNFRTIPIRAVPDKIPASVVIDVTDLDMHEAVRVKDLALGEGVVVQLPTEQALVAVQSERKVVEEETPATAAPAAAGKAPAAAAKAPAGKK